MATVSVRYFVDDMDAAVAFSCDLLGFAEPGPGGWNRFVLEVDDLDTTVAALRGAGATFRTNAVEARLVRS